MRTNNSYESSIGEAALISSKRSTLMKTEFPDGTAGKERTDAAGSMQRFWQLLDSIPDAVVIVNKDGKIGTINAQTERSFGYSRRELLGQPVEILIPERFREKHRFYRARFTANPGVVPMGKVGGSKGLRKNGEEFPVEISLAPLEMDEREDVHILAIVRDTTEQTLAATQMSLHLATERVISSVLEASQNSRSLDELLDFALDQILGMPWISLDPRGAIFLAEGSPTKLVLKAQRGLRLEMREPSKPISGNCLCGMTPHDIHSMLTADNERRAPAAGTQIFCPITAVCRSFQKELCTAC